jgi:hypothetical protein
LLFVADIDLRENEYATLFQRLEYRLDHWLIAQVHLVYANNSPYKWLDAFDFDFHSHVRPAKVTIQPVRR